MTQEFYALCSKAHVFTACNASRTLSCVRCLEADMTWVPCAWNAYASVLAEMQFPAEMACANKKKRNCVWKRIVAIVLIVYFPGCIWHIPSAHFGRVAVPFWDGLCKKKRNCVWKNNIKNLVYVYLQHDVWCWMWLYDVIDVDENVLITW